mgnify:CR=1 FL=1
MEIRKDECLKKRVKFRIPERIFFFFCKSQSYVKVIVILRLEKKTMFNTICHCFILDFQLVCLRVAD